MGEGKEGAGDVSGDGETRGGQGGWMEGRGEEREGDKGGLTIREKFRPVKVSFLPIVLLIKTAPAPELIEGLSLPYSPFTAPHPRPPRSPYRVCERKRRKKGKKIVGPYQCSIMVLPSTSRSAAINIAPITVKGTRLAQDDNEHILSPPAEELKYVPHTSTHVNSHKHACRP